jgi:lambda repressor-like predicted transcriptional regulator
LFDQANNTRKNIIIKYSGKNLSVSQWARETKLKRSTIRNRLSRGWSVEQTLTTPVP